MVSSGAATQRKGIQWVEYCSSSHFCLRALVSLDEQDSVFQLEALFWRGHYYVFLFRGRCRSGRLQRAHVYSCPGVTAVLGRRAAGSGAPLNAVHIIVVQDLCSAAYCVQTALQANWVR